MRVLNTKEVKQVAGGTFGLLRWFFGWGRGGCYGGGHGGHGGGHGGHGHGGHGGHKGGC